MIGDLQGMFEEVVVYNFNVLALTFGIDDKFETP
jgi:hypothetical protein